MRQECDVPRPGHAGGKGGVQARERVHHAQAVWADQPHPAATGFGENLAFQGGSVGAHFLETGRDDDRRFHTRIGALPDHARHRRCRRNDDRQVNFFGQVGDGRIGTDAEHARPLGIDGVNGAAERIANQIPEQCTTDGVGRSVTPTTAMLRG